jgi:tRNA(Ile)-lysidine synthase
MSNLSTLLLADFLEALAQANLASAHIALGLSGGMDSMVLMDLLVRAAGVRPLRLYALHVNHGLSAHAHEWERFCAAQCAARRVRFATVGVQVARAGGESVEASARAARYSVFRAQDVDAVALAHHLDDQAETLLLQLLRGAGPRGLAAMPPVRTPAGGGPKVWRPLLEVARADLARYARARKLQWVEDESNAQLEFDRNYLRHAVLPHIEPRFPGYRQTLLRASRNLADAAEIEDALAQLDARAALENGRLRLNRLSVLPPARARNLLRWYLAGQGLQPPGRDRLQEALRQLTGARAGASVAVEIERGVLLRRDRDLLHIVPVAEEPPADWSVAWEGESELRLPAGLGRLMFDAGLGAGVSARRLQQGRVTIHARRGGERIKLATDRPSRTLKNLLQEAGVPQWRRTYLPLLYCDEQPAWVPGIGIDIRFAAGAREPGIVPRWVVKDEPTSGK